MIPSGHTLDLCCVRLSNVASFCENYATLYFDAKHLEKGFKRNFWGLFFKKKKKVPFLANIERCPKFLEYALIFQVLNWFNYFV